MEQQQRSLLLTAAVGLIILAIIVGSIYYLVRFIQTRVASSRQSTQPSAEIIAQASSSPEGSVQGEQTTGSDQSAANQQEAPAGDTKGGVSSSPLAGDKKVYNGTNFKLEYPKAWGLLTCSNSKNFELNPGNGSDQKVACDTAQKPVTVLVGSSWGCAGENVSIGNIPVLRSKQTDGGYIKYQWCTKTTPVINITHRVSGGNDPATSKADFSAQVEQAIASLVFTK